MINLRMVRFGLAIACLVVCLAGRPLHAQEDNQWNFTQASQQSEQQGEQGEQNEQETPGEPAADVTNSATVSLSAAADTKLIVETAERLEVKTQDTSSGIKKDDSLNTEGSLSVEGSLSAEGSLPAEGSLSAEGSSESVEKEDELAGLVEEPKSAAERRITDTQLLSDIDQQFDKLQKTLETEDAYSLVLAEDYFSYGMMLRESGQYQDAIDAFVNALHIQKINHGIYSAEQRNALKALFELHYALGNTEDFEDYLERILWIEEKNPAIQDDLSFQLLVMVGNAYIDDFMRKPIAGQRSVQTLLRAKHHFNAAFTRHKHKPLSELVMPYGELALISFLESRLHHDVDKTASLEDPRLRRSSNITGRELALASYLENSFPRGSGLLKSYLLKAQAEQNQQHIVKALISLGDFSQLFKRHIHAAEFYQLAWVQAQILPEDDPVRAMFNEPVALPSFDYAYDREPVIPTRPTELVPVSLTISNEGRVTEVNKIDDSELSRSYFTKARRLAKRVIFRPRLIDGKAIQKDNFQYLQRVYAKKRPETEEDQAAEAS